MPCLYFIEQGLMTKTGKRFEWEVGTESGDHLAELFQDYDWADEVLHAHIGKDWYVSAFGDQKAAIEFGSQCWSKAVIGWREWKEKGLTEHRNWWPELYEEFCRIQGLQSDPAASPLMSPMRPPERTWRSWQFLRRNFVTHGVSSRICHLCPGSSIASMASHEVPSSSYCRRHPHARHVDECLFIAATR